MLLEACDHNEPLTLKEYNRPHIIGATEAVLADVMCTEVFRTSATCIYSFFDCRTKILNVRSVNERTIDVLMVPCPGS